MELQTSIHCLDIADTYLAARTAGNARDKYGHGTQIAGAMNGNRAISNSQHLGIANKAPIVSVRALDDEGNDASFNVIAALDWILANHEAHEIRAVNLSLGKLVTP